MARQVYNKIRRACNVIPKKSAIPQIDAELLFGGLEI